jgi:Family of unknown function (DUF6932)
MRGRRGESRGQATFPPKFARIHQASLTEALSCFGSGSARRKWLGERLRELFTLAESTGKLHRAFLWGSYVTAKESPNDLDLLLVMAEDFSLDRLGEDQRILFDYPQARIRFQADVFWTKSIYWAGDARPVAGYLPD